MAPVWGIGALTFLVPAQDMEAQAVGACDTTAAIVPISAMEGRFEWSCERGRVAGRVQRAPTADLQLQVISFAQGHSQ